MPRGRKLTPLTVSEADRTLLQGVANSTTMPHALILHARMILASEDGLINTEAARRVAASRQAVGDWRRRYLDDGIQGPHNEVRLGRPRTYDDERVARVINRALQEKSPNATHWSAHSMRAVEGISASTVSRCFRLFGVKPHLTKTFKLSTDPFFIGKVPDITGIYLNPPDHEMVFCVEEKSQIQAHDRTQPKPPMELGYAEGYTHDYLRHGTTTLFAALDIATGKVIAKCKAQHRNQEFLAFLRLIDKEVPADLDIHLVLDNYATHRHAAVKRWRARVAALPSALHADLLVVAEPSGTLVRIARRAGAEAWQNSRHARVSGSDPGLHGGSQRGREAIRMGCHGPVHARQSRAYVHTYLLHGTLALYPAPCYTGDACDVQHRCSAGFPSAARARCFTGQCRLLERKLW